MARKTGTQLTRKPTISVTIVNTSLNPEKPRYELHHAGVVHQLPGQSALRDLIVKIDAECAAAGVELEIENEAVSEALLAVWRARLKPPVGP